MLSVEEALDIILEGVTPLGVEKVNLLDALERVLAEDIWSPLDMPPFDRSAMDGYAVRAEDVEKASEATPVVLEIIEEVNAGRVPSRVVGEGQAVRVMTGAPIPAGADAVVVQEVTRRLEGGLVEVLGKVEAGENITRKGADIESGELVMKKGTKVNPAGIGLLATMGYTEVKVYGRPKVAILATGDELVKIDGVLTEGKIRNGNSYSLGAAVMKYGGRPVFLGIAPDDVQKIVEKLLNGMGADVIITTGGVSVGEYDFMKEVCEFLGAEVLFWRVKMKPGKSILVARWQGKMLMGLSGSPAAALTSFEIFVRPVLLKLSGHEEVGLMEVKAVMVDDFRKSSPKRRFVRALVEREGDNYLARLAGRQENDVLSSMYRANGFVVIPEGSGPLKAGETVKVLLMQ